MVRVVVPPMPCTRLAIGRHPPLEHDGRLVKLLAFDFCQLVPVNPVLVVQFFWKIHPPPVRTFCVLLTRWVIFGDVEVTPMFVYARFASDSAGVVGAIVDVSGDGGASRAIRITLPGGCRPGRARIVGGSRFRGMLSTL